MIETPSVNGVDYMGHLHYRMHLRSSNVDKAIDKVLGFSIFLVFKKPVVREENNSKNSKNRGRAAYFRFQVFWARTFIEKLTTENTA
jgi:hypothetical protein